MDPASESSRPKAIHGQAFGRSLIEAGLITVEEHVTRVLIDVPVDGPVVMHVQRLGDERLLEIVHGLEGVEVRRAEDERGASDAP